MSQADTENVHVFGYIAVFLREDFSLSANTCKVRARIVQKAVLIRIYVTLGRFITSGIIKFSFLLSPNRRKWHYCVVMRDNQTKLKCCLVFQRKPLYLDLQRIEMYSCSGDRKMHGNG